MDELADFWIHTATVETYTGAGPFGPTYAAPVEVPCFIDETRRLVRDLNGNEVTAEATITGPDEHGHLLTPESRVTLNGRPATVITNAIRNTGGWLPDHFETTTT